MYAPQMTRVPTEVLYPESIDEHETDEVAEYIFDPRGEHEAEYREVEHDGERNVYATPEVDNDHLKRHENADIPTAGQGVDADELEEQLPHASASVPHQYSEDYDDDEMAPPRITRPLPPPPPEAEEESIPEGNPSTVNEFSEPRAPSPAPSPPPLPLLNRPLRGSIRRSTSPSLSRSDSGRRSLDSRGPPRRFIPPPPQPPPPPPAEEEPEGLSDLRHVESDVDEEDIQDESEHEEDSKGISTALYVTLYIDEPP